VTPFVLIKDRLLEPFLFMLNACLSLSWPGLESDHEAEQLNSGQAPTSIKCASEGSHRRESKGR
jgi:hypothetical protein